jgi:hypothetical protein
VVKSYQIVFDNIKEIKPAEILARSLYRSGMEFRIDIKSLFDKTLLKLRVKGEGNGIRFKKILVLNGGKFFHFSDDVAVIANYPKKVFYNTGENIWCLNATKISQKFNCSEEYPLIGAIARTGITTLSSIILEIYRNYDKMDAHKRALAAKRGFESIKI